MLGIEVGSISKCLFGLSHFPKGTQGTAQVAVGIRIGRLKLKGRLKGGASALQVSLSIQCAAKQLQGPEVLGAQLQSIPEMQTYVKSTGCPVSHK